MENDEVAGVGGAAALGSGSTLGDISGDLANSVDFSGFADTMKGAAELQLGTSEVSAVTNSVIALATNVKDTFAKVR